MQENKILEKDAYEKAMKAAHERLANLIHEVTSTIVFFCGADTEDTDYAMDEKFNARFKDMKKAVFDNYKNNRSYYRVLLSQLQNSKIKDAELVEDDKDAGNNSAISDKVTEPEDIPQE